MSLASRPLPAESDISLGDEPQHDCPLCPRLVDFRLHNRKDHPSWYNGPVPSFGDPTARLLIVGLAPGLRGANRTGRPFTGDYAGDLLYSTLLTFGFATGSYEREADDSLRLQDCWITNAVRCVPPENKPTSTEIRTCRRFLLATLEARPQLRVILALGRIAHESVIKALDWPLKQSPFRHGGQISGLRPPLSSFLPHSSSSSLTLFSSYHCSRYNTSTGVLTEASFHALFQSLKNFMENLAE